MGTKIGVGSDTIRGITGSGAGAMTGGASRTATAGEAVMTEADGDIFNGADADGETVDGVDALG